MHYRRRPTAVLAASLALACSVASQTVLNAVNGSAPGDALGTSVGVAADVDGDRVPDCVVGAPFDDTNGTDAGSVQVVSGADGRILWTFFGAAAGDQFGAAVAAAGDVDGDGQADLIVGAPNAAPNGVASGQAVVLSGATGSVLYRFGGPAANAMLGNAVSGLGDIDGDGYADFVLGVVGAKLAGAGVGAASVVSGRFGRVIREHFGVAPGDALGTAVAGAGDVDGDGFCDVLVGVPGDDTNGIDAGSVRVFSGRDGSALLTLLGDAAGDGFGSAVAGAGDCDGDGIDDVLVGASGADGPAGPDAGLARVYSGGSGTVHLSWNGHAAQDGFGAAVGGGRDVDGDGQPDLVIGAPGSDLAGVDAGSAWVFSSAGGTLLRLLPGGAAGDRFGGAIGVGADADGDGYAEILVGAPSASPNGAGAGRATLLGWRPYDRATEVAVLAPATGDSRFGSAMSRAGDVNRDGIQDYLVGARHHRAKFGGVWVYSGADNTLLYRFEGQNIGDSLGNAVGAAGDVDQDGYDDFIVGAWQESSVKLSNGMAGVYSGRDGSVLYSFFGIEVRDHMGTAVDGIGDVNGDGVPDLVVGLGLRFPETEAGAVWVYSGKDGVKLYEVNGQAKSEWFGWSAAGLGGDLDGDGVHDLIVGAPQFLPTPTGPGLVRVLSGVDGRIIRTLNGDSIHDRFGIRIAGIGDADRDGTVDMLVGAPGDDNNGVNSGSARVFSGSTGAILYHFDGEAAGDSLGTNVGAAGDVDADGFADFLVGSPHADFNGPDSGRTYLFSGRDGRLLQFFDGAAPFEMAGSGMAGFGDANGDGYGDLVIGAEGFDGAVPDVGAVRVHWSTMRSDPGSWVAFGASCPGQSGNLPRIGVVGRPVIGSAFSTTVYGGRPLQLGTILIGDSDTSWGSLPLPFPLRGLAPGCTLYANPLLTAAFLLDGRGAAALPLPVANNSSFVGLQLFLQCQLQDPGINPLGSVFSDAAQVTLGVK